MVIFKKYLLTGCPYLGTLRKMINKEMPHLILKVSFYKTESDNEPVREWLKSLNQNCRKAIGEDIKTVQFGCR
jgi:hypothetical protein